jgi:hypothetical protein
VKDDDDNDDNDDVMTTFMRIISRCSSYLSKSNREINLPVDSATSRVAYIFVPNKRASRSRRQTVSHKGRLQKGTVLAPQNTFPLSFRVKKKYSLSSTIFVRVVLFPWKGHRNNRRVLRYLKQHFHDHLQGIRQKHVEHRRE